LDSKSEKLVTYQYTPDGRSGVMGKNYSKSGGGIKIDPRVVGEVNHSWFVSRWR